MPLVDILRGLTKGVAESAGNEDAVVDIAGQQARARQAQQSNLQAQIAPLHQASVGLQKQIQDLTDPTTGQPYAGTEAHHAQLVDQLAGVIGKTRMALHPPPSEDPHGLGYLMHTATDKLHITNDAAQKAREQNAQKVNDYYVDLNSKAAQAARDSVATLQGNPLTPPQQTEAAQIRAGITPKAVAPKAPIETSDTRARTDYANDPNKIAGETFEQWKTRQSGLGRVAVPKAPNRDDRYIAIQQKKFSKQLLSPDEQAYEGAYDLWTQKTKIAPGVARAAAFGAMRYVPVIDPNNPEQVTLMRAGDAARAGVGTPASIGFQTDKAVTRYMTSGAGGTNINYFNTATDHLKLLKEAGDALGNGDVQLFNKLSNKYATATGNPAPTNFETVKSAVAGELSKTFKGTGATDQEIGIISSTLNQAQSPAQINGAVDYYTKLMGSKVDALKSQYEAGREGKPNFQGPKTTQFKSIQGGTSKGTVSLAKARNLPQYQGKSDTEITAAAKSLGYEVKP